MNEQQWQAYMRLLETENTDAQTHCVSCWYNEHSEPFPEKDSSSLCNTHGQATRATFHATKGARYA